MSLKLNGGTGIEFTSNTQFVDNAQLKFKTTSQTFTVKGIDAAITDSQTSTAPDTSDSDSGQLAIYNGATKLWGITEHGYVVKPNIPAFKFGISNDNNTGTTRRIGLNINLLSTRDSFNNGNHFDTTNGRFSAPINGHYYFNFVLQRNANNGSYVDAQIVKNEPAAIGQDSSSTFGRIYRGNYHSSYEQNNVQIITFLSAGDYIAFDIKGGSTYNDDSFIEGYLIG
tara:strand:+ start:127 stop:804 length:678 start_codon:yes stop_codon:yes gene_type:complete